MKRYIHCGVRFKNPDGNYYMDYSNNLPEDLIDFVTPQMYRSDIANNVYWFGYEFNSDVSSSDKTNFIQTIKGLSDVRLSDSDFERFLEIPLSLLNDSINTYHIDAFAYPLSGRSKLVEKMIQVINRVTSRDMTRCSFQLVKSVPTDIYFDWDLFESDYGSDINVYRETKRYINKVLMPKIHDLDYFSLAKNVKTKYRPYIRNFIQFKDSDLEKIQKLQHGTNILVVDDINTSGSTLYEIIRQINELNPNCNIYVYTLIGKH